MVTHEELPERISCGVRGYLTYICSCDGLDEAGRDLMRRASVGVMTWPRVPAFPLKIALDEGVPEGLIEHLPGHDVQSVRQLGLEEAMPGEVVRVDVGRFVPVKRRYPRSP